MLNYRVHVAVICFTKAASVTETVHIKANSAQQLDLSSSNNKKGFDQLLTEVKKFRSALKYPRSIFEILALHY